MGVVEQGIVEVSPTLITVGGLVALGLTFLIRQTMVWWDKKIYGDPKDITSVGPR